jgi:mono/diheme cytochrome c family protein
MHLSLRGKTEFQIFKDYFDSGKDGLVWNGGPNELERKIDAVIEVASKNLAKSSSWKESNDPSKAIKVAAYPYKEGDVKELAESVKRGQYLFLGDEKNHPRGKVANCKQCHDDYGRQARFKFDEWGTLVRPNNFTQGVFRGGRRPVDLYYRVHSGINGSGMTNFGKDLKGEDIWDLVNFVQTLAYPAMQKQLGINIH